MEQEREERAMIGTSLPVVLACDAAYAMPLATALRSIVEANRSGASLEFHVLSEGFTGRIQQKVVDSLPQGSAEVRWVPVDMGPFREFSTIVYISKMTYARFLLPQIFPPAVNRILYLDADLLVLDDLGRLWSMDLEGAILGAVPDHGLDRKIKQRDPRVRNVPRVRDYFNAGVLLIDLERWRSEQVSEKALEYLAGHPQSPFSDQDALNVACDGRWKKLEQRWNFQDHARTSLAHLRPEHRPGIVHFVTDVKPWNASSLSVNADFYDAIRARTRFSRTIPDRMGDLLRGSWALVKGVLRRYAFVRAIRDRLRHMKTTAAAAGR